MSSGNRVNGQDLWVYNSNNTSTQRWRIIPNGDGSYRLMPMCAQHENMVMDIEGPSTAPSAPLQIWTWDDSAPQMRWYLERAETSTCIRNCEYTRMPDDGFAQRWLDAMDGYNKWGPLDLPSYKIHADIRKIAFASAVAVSQQYPHASSMLVHYLNATGEDYTLSESFITDSSDIANFRMMVKNDLTDAYATLFARNTTFEYTKKEVIQIEDDLPGKTDWVLAVNKCDLWGRALVNSSGNVTYTLYIRDVYDYEPNSQYAGLETLFDMAVGALSNMSYLGLAKPYKVSGSTVF